MSLLSQFCGGKNDKTVNRQSVINMYVNMHLVYPIIYSVYKLIKYINVLNCKELIACLDFLKKNYN